MMHRTCDGIVSPASARRAFQRHNVLTCSLILVINRRPFSATNSMRHSNLSVVDDKPPSAATKSIRCVPRFDYVQSMRAFEADPSVCPLLMLAPMENLADQPLRTALSASIGGFDEACREFIRVPGSMVHSAAAVRRACAPYNAAELSQWGIALGAQIMGCQPQLLATAAAHLSTVQGAPRVDLNCGCPANRVTGAGAGSSLLRNPDLLHDCVRSMVAAVGNTSIVSVKMRAGYEDTSLFEDNLLAAQEGGAAFVTVHPRTKQQGYEGRASWSLIARAKQLLQIPVVGNGDVVSVAAAKQLLQETGCQAIMVGRGAVQDPLLFQRIRAAYAQPDVKWDWHEPQAVVAFLRTFADGSSIVNKEAAAPEGTAASNVACGDLPLSVRCSAPTRRLSRARRCASEHGQFGTLKKVVRYLFNATPRLAQERDMLLRVVPGSGMMVEEFLELCCTKIMQEWPASGPSRLTLVNHMGSMQQVVEDSQGLDTSAEE